MRLFPSFPFRPALRRLVIAAALALPAGGFVLPAPVLANSGSVSLSLSARNADEAALLRLGLGLYALRRDLRGGAIASQRGTGHAAGIVQGGGGHRAVVHQEGCNQTGTISQQGHRNSHGLFQFGCNGVAHVDQRGSGQAGVTVQYSW
jgi:hypothetical protein